MKLNSFLAACSFLLLAPAQAALLDRGNGMIYDDVQNLTWLQDTRYAFTSGLTGYDYVDAFNRPAHSVDPYGRMIWSQAMSWTEQLNFGGHSDWRLPTSDKVGGYNHSDSELGYMYYVNLGNKAAFTDGVFNPNYGFVNAGPFLNLPVHTAFWTATPDAQAGRVWSFQGSGGFQGTTSADQYFDVWVVRDGDVAAVPEPSSAALLLLALFGAGAMRLRSTSANQRRSQTL
jgi:hypothetical protein